MEAVQVANLTKAIRCMAITKEDTMVTTEVDEVALTSLIITLATTRVEISVAEVAVVVEGITVAVTCRVVITSTKAEAVEAWAIISLEEEAEVDINMEEVVSTDLKVIMADTMGSLMVVAEILCSPTCLIIRKADSTVVTTTSSFSIKARTYRKTLLIWAWAEHQEVKPPHQLQVVASLSSNRTL